MKLHFCILHVLSYALMQPPNFSLFYKNVLFTWPSLILQSSNQDVFNISKHSHSRQISFSHVTNNSLKNIKHSQILSQYSSDGGDIDLTEFCSISLTVCSLNLMFPPP